MTAGNESVSRQRPTRPERQPMAWPSPVKGGVVVRVTDTVVTSPKQAPVRSEAYRRLVAAMPCIACGCGPCQAAHPNTGKGGAMKADDRLCFPLCADQPGRQGCHSKFDQGVMFSKAARRAIEPAWGADVQRRIVANGQWPAKLPFYESNPGLALTNPAQAATTLIA